MNKAANAQAALHKRCSRQFRLLQKNFVFVSRSESCYIADMQVKLTRIGTVRKYLFLTKNSPTKNLKKKIKIEQFSLLQYLRRKHPIGSYAQLKYIK